MNEYESIIFSYIGRIIAIAKVKEIIIEENKVIVILLVEEKLKVFDKNISLDDLETNLCGMGILKLLQMLRVGISLMGSLKKKRYNF